MNLAIFAACLWAGGATVWLWVLSDQLGKTNDRLCELACEQFGMGRRMDSLDRRVDKVAPMVRMEVE